MMEDHNSLLAATESGSGLVNDAMRRRSALVLVCVLVALGALFCVGKVSQAKPPALAPEPGGSATSQRPASHDPPRAPIAEERAPVARDPASRPAQQPDGRTVPDQGPTTEAGGRQVGPQQRAPADPVGSEVQGREVTVEAGPPLPVSQRPAERVQFAGWE